MSSFSTHCESDFVSKNMLSRVRAALHLSPVPLPSWKHCTQHGRCSAPAAFLENPLQNHREKQHLLSTFCVAGPVLDAKGTASDTEMPRMDYGQDHAGEEAKIWRGQGARSRTPSSWLKGTGFKPKPTGSYVNLVVPCYLRATTLGLCHCPSAFLLSLHLLWHLSLPLHFSFSLSLSHTRTHASPLLGNTHSWSGTLGRSTWTFSSRPPDCRPGLQLLSSGYSARMPKSCFSSTLVNMVVFTCEFVCLLIWWVLNDCRRRPRYCVNPSQAVALQQRALPTPTLAPDTQPHWAQTQGEEGRCLWGETWRWAGEGINRTSAFIIRKQI